MTLTSQNKRWGEKLFLIYPTPYPQGQSRFKQFPTPRPKGLDLSRGLPGRRGGGGGVVTGQIEPCIRKIDVFILSLSSTCLLLRCFIFRMVLHRGKRETQVTGYMQSFIERETSGYEASLVLFHRYKQWKKVHQNKTNLVQE